MNLGIIGGAFDPIHYGHLEIGKQALKKLDLEEVWFMPCYNHVFDKKIESFHHRYKMIELALNETAYKRLKVSDYEGKRKDKSYTIDTVRDILKENPNIKIYWIMGVDAVETLDRWKEPDKLVKLAKIVIIPRNGKSSKLPENSIYLEAKIPDISSTGIKKMLKDSKSIEGLTPKSVIEYIKENNLYSTIE